MVGTAHPTNIQTDVDGMNLENLSQKNKWCLGAPCTGSRPLSFVEISFLRKRLRITRTTWISLAVFSIALPLFTFILFYFLDEILPEFYDIFFAIITIAMLFIGFPVLFSLANDYFKKAKKLKKDTRSGFIYRFEGVLDESENFLEELKSPPSELTKKHTFEVFPNSGFIFSINGNLLKTRYEVEITEAASAPESPYIISLPRDVLQIDNEQNAELLRRRLTPDEIDELKNHAAQLCKLSKPAFVFMLFMTCLAFWGAVTSESVIKWFAEFKIQLIVLSSFLLYSIYSYIRNFLYARKFKEDIKLGWVIISSRHEEPSNEEQQEILPVSSALWTEKGKPSNWRMQQAK
ncbi:MAG: hypothetical protein IT362_00040 [Deltaproteobacteria bacterium]|nr:hypothetical protein [Deltaproteobacteria bacterium]